MPTLDSVSTQSTTFVLSLIAGGIAGTTVDVSLYPIDTLKTRLQSSQGFSASGGFRGIYAGVGSAVVGSAPGAALFFVTYERTKQLLKGDWESSSGFNHRKKASWREPVEHMFAASFGEVAACAIRVPTEVVKQRTQAMQYPSSFSALSSILAQYNTRGLSAVLREFYRGWNITILREVPFTVIQFPLWEAMKKRRLRKNSRNAVTATESAIFGSISGAIAAAATTPLDVLKTRMILASEKQKLLDVARFVWRNDGAHAFFAGIVPRVLWISAGGAIFLGSYQYATNALRASL